MAETKGIKVSPRSAPTRGISRPGIDWARAHSMGIDFKRHVSSLIRWAARRLHARPAADEGHPAVFGSIMASPAAKIGEGNWPRAEFTLHHQCLDSRRGFKDVTIDRRAPRERLIHSLDQIFHETLDSSLCSRRPWENKLFGIGSECYVVGSHEFLSRVRAAAQEAFSVSIRGTFTQRRASPTRFPR